MNKNTLKAKAIYSICIEICDHTLKFCSTPPVEVYDLLYKYGFESFDENMQPTTPVLDNEFRNVYFILK